MPTRPLDLSDCLAWKRPQFSVFSTAVEGADGRRCVHVWHSKRYRVSSVKSPRRGRSDRGEAGLGRLYIAIAAWVVSMCCLCLQLSPDTVGDLETGTRFRRHRSSNRFCVRRHWRIFGRSESLILTSTASLAIIAFLQLICEGQSMVRNLDAVVMVRSRKVH